MSIKRILTNIINIADTEKYSGSHIIIDYDFINNIEDNENLIRNLFRKKITDRYCKIIYNIKDKEYDIKNIIKTITNYGFDGIMFDIYTEMQFKQFKKLIKTITLLPLPYNFKWDFFIKMSNESYIDYINLKNKYKDMLNIYLISQNLENDTISNIDQVKIIKNRMELYSQKTFFENIYTMFDIDNTFIIDKCEMNNLNYPTSDILNEM